MQRAYALRPLRVGYFWGPRGARLTPPHIPAACSPVCPCITELDVLSDVSKITVLVAWLRSAQMRQEDAVYSPESVLFAPFVFITWATVLSLAFIWRRLHHLRETQFVAEHGYSNKWQTKVRDLCVGRGTCWWAVVVVVVVDDDSGGGGCNMAVVVAAVAAAVVVAAVWLW